MNSEIRRLLFLSLRDGEDMIDAFEKYRERIAICIHDGGLSEQDAETVALSDLKERIKGQNATH